MYGTQIPNITVYIKEDPLDRAERLAWQGRIEQKLSRIIEREGNIMDAVDRLEKDVEGLTEVVQGVVTVIDALIADVRNAGGNQTRINAALDKAEVMKQTIAEAVARGTAADAEVNPPPAA